MPLLEIKCIAFMPDKKSRENTRTRLRDINFEMQENGFLQWQSLSSLVLEFRRARHYRGLHNRRQTLLGLSSQFSTETMCLQSPPPASWPASLLSGSDTSARDKQVGWRCGLVHPSRSEEPGWHLSFARVHQEPIIRRNTEPKSGA